MTFATWVTGIVGAINTVVIPLILALAALAFLWGVVNYFFLHSGEEDKRVEARQFVIWGLLGIVVLFSVWGLVNLLLSTLGIAP
jgi:zinc transporter ZupT